VGFNVSCMHLDDRHRLDLFWDDHGVRLGTGLGLHNTQKFVSVFFSTNYFVLATRFSA
jgi:hypothetical protein